MIGVLDWGIGGLGFVRALRAAQPGVRVLYLSDAGFTPYGKLPAAQLAARVQQLLGHMRAQGASQVVVACNAASTVLPRLGVNALAGELLTPAGPLQVSGVIAHALGMARRARPGLLGVIGGARTIRSHAYGRPLRASGMQVRERIAQPLSARIERGELGSAVLLRELREILGPLQTVDTLLLGCTHYAAITTSISAALPEGVRILDPIDALLPWVQRHWQLTAPRGQDCVLTTGDPRAMQRSAQAAFGVELPTVTRLKL